MPLGEKANALTKFEWPLNALRDAPDAVSQSRSMEAEASCLLLGENTTALIRFEWPLSVPCYAPVIAFQSRTVQ